MDAVSPSNNYMRLEFPSVRENVALARMAVAIFAGQLPFTLDEIEEIKVATSEAVSNAVIHGYKGTSGLIVVTAALLGDQLEVVIEDRGHGIDDLEQAWEPGWTTDPENRMGLGLVFMREYMDDVEITSRPRSGTRVRMVKSPEQLKVSH